MIDKNRISGAIDEFGGKLQSEIGDLAGSTTDSLAGRARTVTLRRFTLTLTRRNFPSIVVLAGWYPSR